MSVENGPKVPTLRAVDHSAYTVPSLDEAVDFFVAHFGAELVFYDGPFRDEESDGMRRRLNVDPRAESRIAMIRIERDRAVIIEICLRDADAMELAANDLTHAISNSIRGSKTG